MGNVRVHQAADVEWVTLRSLYPPHLAAALSDAELDSTMTPHEQGSEGSLHLSEYAYLPHARFDWHAHDQAEIIYVLEGSLMFGEQELTCNSSVYIAEHTLYAFAAGAGGARVLIFMADGRAQYFSKDEILNRQAVQHPPTA